MASGRGGLEHSPEEVPLKLGLRGKRSTRASGRVQETHSRQRRARVRTRHPGE